MVRLIMGEKGTGKTKKLIEMINTTAQEDNGSVVCVEAKSTMTFDLHYHVRLISAYEYDLSNYEALRGFLFGLYAGNYDISHIFIDNLFKITGGECNQAADDFLNELERFSNATGVKFTISVSGDPALATDGMQKYCTPNDQKGGALPLLFGLSTPLLLLTARHCCARRAQGCSFFSSLL